MAPIDQTATSAYPKLINPTLSYKGFQIGDFVEFLLYDIKPSFGVVTEVIKKIEGLEGGGICLAHLENGHPFIISKWCPYFGGLRKAGKEEALAYFQSISDGFNERIEEGDLSGALAAREKHELNSIVDGFKAEKADPYKVIMAPVRAPETGVYVLRGVYSGHGPSDHLEGLIAVPRIDENKVSKIMMKLKPKGFGNIPSDVHNTHATSHGSLVAMWCYEIPETAVGFVVNPKKLKCIGAHWRFGNALQKS